MSTKHTPGPWRVSDDDQDFVHCATDHYHQISAGKGYYGGEPNTGFGLQGFLSLSDARLISAAPELLDALEEVMDEISGRIELEAGTRFRVCAAIRKALGEEK